MKKIFPLFFSLALVAVSTTATFAQLRKIPAEATNAFTAKYPAASNVEWKDKLSGFTADYTIEDIKYTASFNNKGDWENTEQEIVPADLPAVITDSYNKSKYADWTIGKVHKIDIHNDAVQYRVEAVKNDIQKRNLYFNTKGRLLKDKITI